MKFAILSCDIVRERENALSTESSVCVFCLSHRESTYDFPYFCRWSQWHGRSAVCRRLSHEKVVVLTKARKELDLCDESAVRSYFQQHRPKAVVFASAKVGGIKANNDFPVQFLVDNLRQELATIIAAYECGVDRFPILG